MIRLLLPILGLALLLAGWGCREQSTLATDRDPPTGAITIALPGPPLTIYSRNTGDVKDWPSYDLPLRITCEVPEVPKAIRGPFPKLPEKPHTPEK